MGPNVTAFLLGVLVAVASFLVKEISSEMVRAVRFRRRLVQDIKTIIEGHKGHYPELKRLKEAVPKNALSFIWDSTISGVNLSENDHHLKLLESSQCSRFYDELSRIGEIRAEYNLSVRSAITEEAKRALYSAVAVACLGDLQRYYQQVIKRGCKCLLELKKNHWFLEIDEAQCQEELNKDGE